MTRRLVLFLALLLPLQFAWAAASTYCQHESVSRQARHFGHHEHRHEAAAERPSISKLAPDTDCGTCHAAASPVIFDASASAPVVRATAAVVPHAPRRVPNALARAPDRPQWPRLA